MITLFSNSTIFNKENIICLFDCREPMGDDNKCCGLLIVLSDSWIIFSEILSSELVASSKISILGFTIIDLAKEILCLSPPERGATISNNSLITIR